MASNKILQWADGNMTPVGLAEAPIKDIIANKDNFFLAITNASERGVKAFIDNHPDCVTWTTDKQGVPYKSYNGGTGLAGAAIWDNPKIADMLIKAGADINAQDKDGNTPLHRAFEERHGATGKWLVENGARPDIPNRDGARVLDMLGGGEVSNLVRDKWNDKPDDYGRNFPSYAGSKFVNGIETPGNVVIKDVGPGTTIRNIKSGGNITITGNKPPKR